MEQIFESLSSQKTKRGLSAFFLVRPASNDQFETAPIAQYKSFFANVSAQQVAFAFDTICLQRLICNSQRIIGFLDPSSQPENPGWPLRNLLAYLTHIESSSSSGQFLSFNVLCWRDTEYPRAGQQWKSRFGTITQASSTEAPTARPSAIGWERNAAGKLGPRLADLAPMMDPTQ